MRTAAAATHDLDADLMAAQRNPRSFGLQALTASHQLGEVLSRAASAFFGTGFVDLVGALGSIGEDQDLIARHLQEAAANAHGLLGARPLDADHPRNKRGQERRMAWQDTDHALGARRDHHIDRVFGINLTLRGNDVDPQWHFNRA